MDKFAALCGRQYHLFDYVGAADADRVVVIMGSGCGVVEETVEKLVAEGQKIGLVKVRLYRPFDNAALLAALPKSVKKIAVLDRTKEPGASGEPLYQDVITALAEEGKAPLPQVIGGRYGLSSKEFTPAMAAAVFAELAKPAPKRHFTVGINDDVTHLSLDYDPRFTTEGDDTTRAVFFGLGSDGTVSANRSSVKIVGETTPLHAQGYFVYDSRKAGSVTTSHVRFSPRPIKGSYLVHQANFVACHQVQFLERIDMLSMAEPGATFLLNTPYGPDEVWDKLPAKVQQVDHRQEAEVLRGRCLPRGPRGPDGRADQHRDADLFLQAAGRHSAGGGHRPHQGPDQEDLRQEGRRHRGRAEQRRRGRRPGGAEGR